MSTVVEGATSTTEAAPVMRPPINLKWDQVSAQVNHINFISGMYFITQQLRGRRLTIIIRP